MLPHDAKKKDADFQTAVVARDQVCVLCGQQRKLGAHHLVKRKYLRSRWDIKNGVTACWIPCHTIIEKNPHEYEDTLAWKRPGASFKNKAEWLKYKRWAMGRKNEN